MRPPGGGVAALCRRRSGRFTPSSSPHRSCCYVSHRFHSQSPSLGGHVPSGMKVAETGDAFLRTERWSVCNRGPVCRPPPWAWPSPGWDSITGSLRGAVDGDNPATADGDVCSEV